MEKQVRPFQELIVWRKSHLLVLALYDATRKFPVDERFALTTQIRRAASSVPANIAEGSARSSVLEFNHFLSIALGSATELEYHLLLARDLGYIEASDHERLDSKLAEVKRMLAGFQRRLRENRITKS